MGLTAGATDDPDASDKRRRRLLAVQRSRAMAYVIAFATVALLKVLGGLAITYPALASLTALSLATVLAFDLLIRARVALADRLQWLWMALDIALVTVAIWQSGGLASPIYLMYSGNVLGAAFTSRRWAAACAIASTAAYLTMLVVVGHTTFGGAGFFEGLGRMILLLGAFYFALQGVAGLQRRREEVARMRDDDHRKVAELTRLTLALDERTQALHDANLKIRAADRMKSQFLANMSHELRTPLNSIIGFSDVLVQRLGDKLEGKHRRFLETINSSGNHLLGLINDILDLSKIEAGKMDLAVEPVDVAPAVEGVFAVMKGVAGPRRITLEADVAANLPEIEADPVRLKQILYNLLSNAVKFSPEGAVVTCRVRERLADDSPLDVDSIEIKVVDRGIGISAENHALIFQEFRQVDGGAGRRYEGTGLGLALVRRFVELHRGQIALDSKLGVGSTFTVTLPVEAVAGEGDAHQTLTPMLPRDPRPMVLIVEDDPTAYDRIAGELAGANYRCLRTTGGEEALRLAKSLRPAVITLDMVGPGDDALRILRRLKDGAQTRDIPVVVISMADARDLGAALGLEATLVKPSARLVPVLQDVLLRARFRGSPEVSRA